MHSRGNVLIVAHHSEISIYHRDDKLNWQLKKTVRHLSGIVEQIAINPGRTRFVTCGDNGKTVLWKSPGDPITGLPSVGPVVECRFSSDGRWLATLSRAGGINLWESNTGKPMGPTIQGRSKIVAIEWSGDQLILGGNQLEEFWLSAISLPENWTETSDD